jgi:hypothetical protein
MRLAIHAPDRNHAAAVDREQAAYVVGVLSLLIDVVGPTSFLATLLRQTRSEVLSLTSQDGPLDQQAA